MEEGEWEACYRPALCDLSFSEAVMGAEDR